MFFAGLHLLDPDKSSDAQWMCAMVNVEYNRTTYPCPVFDWITKNEASFAVGKGAFVINLKSYLSSCPDGISENTK